MSSILYGSLTKKRLEVPPKEKLGYEAFLLKDDGSLDRVDQPAVPPKAVTKWQDTLAALVPAEILALHGILITIATDDGGTVDSQFKLIAIVLALLPAALYVVGAKSLTSSADVLRMLVPCGAFFAWTFLQPVSAFDAYNWDLSSVEKLMVGAVGAIILGALAARLATKADEHTP